MSFQLSVVTVQQPVMLKCSVMIISVNEI